MSNDFEKVHQDLSAIAAEKGWEVLPDQELDPGYGLLQVKRHGEAIVVSWSPAPGEKHMAVHAEQGVSHPIYYSFDPEDIDVYVRNLL